MLRFHYPKIGDFCNVFSSGCVSRTPPLNCAIFATTFFATSPPSITSLKIGDLRNVFSLKRAYTHFLPFSPSGNAVFFVFLMSTTVDIYSDFITQNP